MSHCVENSLWKKLWTCCEIDCVMNGMLKLNVGCTWLVRCDGTSQAIVGSNVSLQYLSSSVMKYLHIEDSRHVTALALDGRRIVPDVCASARNNMIGRDHVRVKLAINKWIY
jgi:hypothetical protein